MNNEISSADEPFVFEPIFMERIWGGRRIAEVFGKALPEDLVIGESWELCDRPEAQSCIKQGELSGTTLHELWSTARTVLFGEKAPDCERFPLLIKILDACDKLSVQVHPPASLAQQLGGEAKTEMWYVAAADTGADLYVGLKKGTTREAFQEAITDGHTDELLHRIVVKAGDFMFLPSGRLHAIGAGNLIFEIQQNSDTTYRVFDWNRKGLNGEPRDLHIEQSMQSIDFDDFEPALSVPTADGTLVTCDFFVVSEWEMSAPRSAHDGDSCAIVAVINGQVRCGSHTFSEGEFFLVPACMTAPVLTPVGETPVKLLRTVFP